MKNFRELTTDRLRLRLPAAADVGALVELAGDFRIFDTTANIPHPYRASDAEDFIARAHAEHQAAQGLHLVASELATDELVGYAMLRFDEGLNAAELGYFVGAPYWGRGYATEAARAMVDYAFAELALTRLSACHLARNPESGRVLRKLGFTEEGVQREHSFKYGYGEDLVLSGYLLREWLAHKPNAGKHE